MHYLPSGYHKTACFFDDQAKTVTAWLGSFDSSAVSTRQSTFWSIYFSLYKIFLMEKILVLWKTVKGTWNSSLLKKTKFYPPPQEFYLFKSNIHVFNTFWVNFVYGIRWWSIFILLHVAFQFSHHLITLRCSRLGISLFSTLVFLLNVSFSLNNRSKYAL